MTANNFVLLIFNKRYDFKCYFIKLEGYKFNDYLAKHLTLS